MSFNLENVDAGSTIGALLLLGILGAFLVYRHARTKLKLSKETIRDTEFPGRG